MLGQISVGDLGQNYSGGNIPVVLGRIGCVWGVSLAGYRLSAPGERQRDEERGDPSNPVHHFLRNARPSGRIPNDQARAIVFTSSTPSLRSIVPHHQPGLKNIISMYNNFSDFQGNCKTNPEEAAPKLAGKALSQPLRTASASQRPSFSRPRSDRAIAWVNALALSDTGSGRLPQARSCRGRNPRRTSLGLLWRLLTEDGNVGITGRDVREGARSAQAVREGTMKPLRPRAVDVSSGLNEKTQACDRALSS